MQTPRYLITLLLSLASHASASDTIIIRSGSVANAPGAPGAQIDNGTCIATAGPLTPLSGTAFGPEFGAACAGANPYVATPPPGIWMPSLPCDPEARWINSDLVTFPPDPLVYGDPRSVLYCFPFDVNTLFGSTICEARITLCWAVDDSFGDPSANSPNPIGVYVNGTPLSNAFKGGSRLAQSTAAQTITGLVWPGVNHLYIYQRDVGAGFSGVLFSAKIVIDSSPPCTPGVADTVLEFVSGQYQGAPQAIGGPVDNAVCLGNGVPLNAYQATPFSIGDFLAACQQGTAPVVVLPQPLWLPGLACDPEARWINQTAGPLGYGQPAQSTLYCIPIPITQPFCNVQLDLCWAADDYLGDPSGPNTIGAYINGAPLSAAFSGGNFATESSVSMNVTNWMSNVGMNYLVLYQRDAGALVSGIIYSARFTITPHIGCPPPGLGLQYCGPAVVNSSGLAGSISASGSPIVVSNDLILVGQGLTTNAFAYFLASQTQGFVANPGGSRGNICLGGSIGRVVGGAILNSGVGGSVAVAANLTAMPQPNGPVVVAPGDTWNFQCWYRDSFNGAATSNFTEGLSILFN